MAGQAKGAAQRTKGKVKEVAGAATGNRKLERKGKRDQTAGSLKKAGSNLKKAVHGK
jgi:uncharacterized protein YjbJ (UPF0337 family)